MSTSTSTSSEPRYKLIFTVPHSSLEACKSAVFAKGAGSYPNGKYTLVSFETAGTGQFLPGEGASPNVGAVGTVERVPETRVEVLCVGKEVMTGAVDALKRAHPYEEPAYEVYKMEDV